MFIREKGAKAREDANGNIIPPKSKPTFHWLRGHMEEHHPGEWEWHVRPHAASVRQSSIDGVRTHWDDEPEVVEDEWSEPVGVSTERDEDTEVPLDMLLFLG
jgi:hypothetical protein